VREKQEIFHFLVKVDQEEIGNGKRIKIQFLIVMDIDYEIEHRRVRDIRQCDRNDFDENPNRVQDLGRNRGRGHDLDHVLDQHQDQDRG